MAPIDPSHMTTLLVLTLLVVVALAVWQDLARQRIPNVLTISGLAAALALQALEGGMPGIVSALAGAGVGLVCFLPLYLAKGMGVEGAKVHDLDQLVKQLQWAMQHKGPYLVEVVM